MRAELIDINLLKENPDNPRTITDEKLAALVKSVQNFPEMMEVRPLAVKSDYTVLGGNMRLRAAKAAGMTKIPVIFTEWTEQEQREFIIKDNVGFGDWEWDEIQANWPEAPEWGLDIPDWALPKKEAVEDNYEIPDEIETDIVLGDLIEIGPHRLLCGDSTKAEDVERLMDGQKADIVFTDPPYGVNIKGGKNNSMIAGDITQTAIPFGFDLAARVATKSDARFYFCGGEGNIGLYHKLFEKYCRQLPRHLIWVKNGFVMKPNGYHNQYEIVFHGYKPKGGGLDHWFGGRKEDEASDVWRISRDASSNYEHPTQKPIAIPARAIKNSCPEYGLIYEPFTGSGSTMVAAHQLNRKCYGIEIDPKYCQVIVDRMKKLDPAIEIKKNGVPLEFTGIKQVINAVS